jgi:putative nucleotidyltransferase with HDIG domain
MTIRILVAEDEENIRFALKTIASKNLPCDEVVTCENGEVAWEKLQAENFSLVISDWNMPLKTGFELLEAMRGNEQTRNVPMLLLTARSDKTSVISALQAGVSDYITKPFDKDMLVQKANKLLAKSLAAHAQEKPAEGAQGNSALSVADEVIKRIRSGETALPVLPELADKVEELFQQSDVDLAELVKVVQTDPGITSKLISISNSPQYRGMAEIKSLDKAISRIGLKMTQSYVLILAKRGLFKVNEPRYEATLNRIWQHSLATAACARALAHKLALNDADGYYTMGLLHDIGKLLLLQIFSEIAKKRADATEQQCLELMDRHHGEFGAMLLAKWKFPGDYQQVALYHEEVGKAGQTNNALLVVALANLLAIQGGFQATDSAIKEEEIQQLAQQLRAGASVIEAVTQQMSEHMAAQAEL